jgi:DTW domain-containing protein YfiP
MRSRLPFNLLILRHWREAERPSNSGQLIPSCIENAQVVDLQASYKEVRGLIPRGNTWLLFPPSVDPSGSIVIPSRKGLPRPLPDTVVVVDGTWSEAHSMARKLEGIPRFLPLYGPRAFDRIRKPPSAEGMATSEAVAAMIEEVNPRAAACLDQVFAEFVTARKPGNVARKNPTWEWDASPAHRQHPNRGKSDWWQIRSIIPWERKSDSTRAGHREHGGHFWWVDIFVDVQKLGLVMADYTLIPMGRSPNRRQTAKYPYTNEGFQAMIDEVEMGIFSPMEYLALAATER